jgi:hypothetical protein
MPLIRGEQISGSVASASYALTASYALNSSGTGFPFSGSAVITGSLVVTGGITGSMNITNLSSGSYTQSFNNQSTWTVQHNLNSAYVVVQTYDTDEEQMLPQIIDLTDANTTTITFPIAISGTAVVMVGTPLAGGGGGGNTAVSASYATTASFAVSSSRAVSAASATTAITFQITNTPNTAGTYYPVFVGSTSGFLTGRVDATTFVYDTTTNNLTVTASYANQALSASYAASASLATDAQRVITVQTTTGTGPYYPVFASTSGVSAFLRTDPTTFTYNATTNTLTVTSSAAISASYADHALSLINTGSFYTTSSFGFYGAFCSTGSQTNPVANVSRSMTLETTEHSNGVSITGGSRITVAKAGAYNLQFSAQLEKTNNGVDIVYIWFKKNGSNVARSATAIDVTKSAGGGGRAVAAWNYIDTYNAGDYVEIIWQSADTAMILAADPASGNLPAIPSVIATLNQIS